MKLKHTHPKQVWKMEDWASIPEAFRGVTIQLIHEDDVWQVQPGDQLLTINGKVIIAGEDPMDMDTRGGYLAYGYVIEES